MRDNGAVVTCVAYGPPRGSGPRRRAVYPERPDPARDKGAQRAPPMPPTASDPTFGPLDWSSKEAVEAFFLATT